MWLDIRQGANLVKTLAFIWVVSSVGRGTGAEGSQSIALADSERHEANAEWPEEQLAQPLGW
jgi:cobalamin biosynthesis protein CobD/CbiB